MTLTVYLCTGGLWPVTVPYRYELNATAYDATGSQRQYTITDESSCRVWVPGLLQHSLGHLVDPSVSGIRKNLYRTLLKRMADEGLLDVLPGGLMGEGPDAPTPAVAGQQIR